MWPHVGHLIKGSYLGASYTKLALWLALCPYIFCRWRYIFYLSFNTTRPFCWDFMHIYIYIYMHIHIYMHILIYAYIYNIHYIYYCWKKMLQNNFTWYLKFHAGGLTIFSQVQRSLKIYSIMVSLIWRHLCRVHFHRFRSLTSASGYYLPQSD